MNSASWSMLKNKPGPGPLHGHAACRLPSCMLIFGGESGGLATNELWRFHFGTALIRIALFFIVQALRSVCERFAILTKAKCPDRHGNLGKVVCAGTKTAAEGRERRSRGVRAVDSRNRHGQSETETQESTAQTLQQQNIAKRGARPAQLPQRDLQVVADKSIEAQSSDQVQLLGSQRTGRQRGKPSGGMRARSNVKSRLSRKPPR